MPRADSAPTSKPGRSQGLEFRPVPASSRADSGRFSTASAPQAAHVGSRPQVAPGGGQVACRRPAGLHVASSSPTYTQSSGARQSARRFQQRCGMGLGVGRAVAAHQHRALASSPSPGPAGRPAQGLVGDDAPGQACASSAPAAPGTTRRRPATAAAGASYTSRNSAAAVVARSSPGPSPKAAPSMPRAPARHAAAGCRRAWAAGRAGPHVVGRAGQIGCAVDQGAVQVEQHGRHTRHQAGRRQATR
jgi:hypothetical protein